MYCVVKFLISALVVALASEIAKRTAFMGAIVAALPITSILVITWLYLDTGDLQKVTELSTGIFWSVLPSLLFFFVLPICLKSGLKFGPSMFISSAVMVIGYLFYTFMLGKFGVKF